MKYTKALLLIITCLTLSQTVYSQVFFPGYYQQEYYDVLKMKNDFKSPITLRPGVMSMYQLDSALTWDIWDGKLELNQKRDDFIEILDPMTCFSYSSAYPDSYNDGAVWKGKGLNSSFNFGFTGRKGILHFTFAPVVYYAQNKDFFIADGPFDKNEFSYPFERRIDWVIRYGDDAVAKFHPGQSEVRLIHKKITIGLSTQNMIWGPAQVSPILMSNNAGGIPHLDFGSPGPIKTKIGELEYRIFWGQMNESDFFDSNSDNDKRYLTGAVLGYKPNFIPGLQLGFNRVMYRQWFDGDFKPLDIFASLWNRVSDDPSPNKNDEYDQMFSLMVRWQFKEYGFDAYIEWARNDFPGTLTDLLENPERTRAVTMGMVKTFDLSDGSLLRFVYEHTKLNKIKMSVATTGHPTYYVHSVVENGYTNDGQIMGSYTGPGSNAHHLKLQRFTKNGRIGINFDRVRFNDDYFIQNFAGTEELPNETRYRLGIDYLRFLGDFSVDANLTLGHHRNWYYDDDINAENLSLLVRVGYSLNN